MNYNNEILENKEFNFFKQLMYNIALAICIMLVGVFVLVYGFNFRLYNVESGSEEPYIMVGDMVVVKEQAEYNVGDIIKYDKTTNNTFPVTHRLIGIFTDNGGTTFYICHGDNVDSADPNRVEHLAPWEEDAKYVADYFEQCDTIQDYENGKFENKPHNIDVIYKDNIEGKVVGVVSNYGTYFNFIKQYPAILVAIVGGVWCITEVLKNEIEMKKTRRLL